MRDRRAFLPNRVYIAHADAAGLREPLPEHAKVPALVTTIAEALPAAGAE